MQIVLNVKNRGEVTFSVFPENQQEDCNTYLLVEKEEDCENPIATITINGADYEFKQMGEIDDVSLSQKMDSLFSKIIQAKKQGYVFEITGENIESPYDPERIRIDTKSFSLRQIQELIQDGDLNLTPDFQRFQVWDNKKKSRLIESILLRIPLPVFYFVEDEEGRLTVVDGLQRLTAITEFMNNKLKLTNLEYLDCCEEKKYSEESAKLEDKYFRRFNTTQISVNIIDPQSPPKVKYDIFRRLNTGGMQLNQQEIRNCLASATLRNTLNEMIQLPAFKKATGNMSNLRMQAAELALRYIFFKNLSDGDGVAYYSGRMDDELDKCVDEMSKKGSSELAVYVETFSNAMKNSFYLFGRHCFRKVSQNSDDFSERSVLNKLLFTSWSVVLSRYDYDEIKELFSPNCLVSVLGEELSSDAEYDKYVSVGTNSKKNVIYSFEKAKKIMESLRI